jgi:hypothetical protein
MTTSNVPTYFLKSKSFTKSYGTKQYHKSSYTIHEKPPNEKMVNTLKKKKNPPNLK